MNTLQPIRAGGTNRFVAPTGPAADQRAPGGVMSMLRQYYSIARRRKWIILGIIAATMTAGLIITLLMTPRYTSSATLEIQRETRNFTQVQGAQPDEQANSIDQEFYETQYGLLRARSLAEAVATKLRVYNDPAFFEMFGANSDKLFANGKPIGGESTRASRIDAAGSILLNNFTVSPERLSRLVTISFVSPDRQFSQKVVDAWSQQFISQTLGRRFEATSYARNFLEQRLQQLRSRIDESERQLVDYASRQGIVNIPGSSSGDSQDATSGERSLVVDDLSTLNRELARATADRVQAQSRLGSGSQVTESLQSGTLSQLRERRAELAADYARMMVQFEPGYPPARALKNQIDQLDRSIGAEESRVSSTLQQSYRAAADRETALRNTVSQLKTGVLDNRRRSIQYNILSREVDTNRQLYDALLQRYKEIGVAGGVGVNNIAIVDPPLVPERPSSPRLILNMLLALIVGTVLGGVAALIMEQFDEAIADPAEIEELLSLPLLGTIPKASETDPVVALADRKSLLTEAYQSLRTSLSFSTDHGVPAVFSVTSTRAGEGKSTTSYALARLLARMNRRTILIDGDMRSPSVHHELGIVNKEGLSNYLSGGTNDVDSLIMETTHDGLFVMVAGPQPPSSPELLSSDRFAQVLTALRDRFDHVVIDSPPVLGLADATIIGNNVEGMIFVIESHGTKKSMARVSIGRLMSANVPVLGAVLTKFDEKRAHYGYGYNYGYGHGYGYGDRNNADRA